MILVVMAAGLGSRFGGIKQMTGVGPNEEFIIDYSVYDAIQAGFKKVVFIIRKDIYDDFRNTIGKRIENKIDVEYVFQDINDIPEGFSVPSDRVKPWGTGHAVLSARDVVDDNFVVINADDFYGRESFIKIADYLKNVDKSSKKYSMVSYKLINTMSDYGSVSRGICNVDNGKLVDINERTNIVKKDGNLVYIDEGEHLIDKDALVSVNFWGFTPSMFEDAYKYFIEFFKSNSDLSKKEFYLPTIVKNSIEEGIASVSVLESESKFSGMTYKEDREELSRYICELVNNGIYPNNLWD
jgi:UTP-glucose-1-phosphate uridylyltransferase